MGRPARALTESIRKLESQRAEFQALYAAATAAGAFTPAATALAGVRSIENELDRVRNAARIAAIEDPVDRCLASAAMARAEGSYTAAAGFEKEAAAALKRREAEAAAAHAAAVAAEEEDRRNNVEDPQVIIREIIDAYRQLDDIVRNRILRELLEAFWPAAPELRTLPPRPPPFDPTN